MAGGLLAGARNGAQAFLDSVPAALVADTSLASQRGHDRDSVVHRLGGLGLAWLGHLRALPAGGQPCDVDHLQLERLHRGFRGPCVQRCGPQNMAASTTVGMRSWHRLVGHRLVAGMLGVVLGATCDRWHYPRPSRRPLVHAHGPSFRAGLPFGVAVLPAVASDLQHGAVAMDRQPSPRPRMAACMGGRAACHPGSD